MPGPTRTNLQTGVYTQILIDNVKNNNITFTEAVNQLQKISSMSYCKAVELMEPAKSQETKND